MAETDYKFMVYSDTLTPFGVVGKENLDVLRLKYDFTCYLETGESVSEIMFPTVSPVFGQEQQNRYWKQDYPPDGVTTTVELPPDDYTLTVVSEAITGSGNEIDIKLTAGTPGYTYVMTFVAVGSTTRRRKQVDTTIYIEVPLNPSMVGPGTLNPDIVPPIVVNGSVALPIGFSGLVILENSSNSTSLVITLPPNPAMGQLVDFIDALGKDGLYPVTFRADADGPLDGDGSTTFVSITAYEALRFVWVGSNWHIEPQRFGFLG
jgi:hypothetical protein